MIHYSNNRHPGSLTILRVTAAATFQVVKLALEIFKKTAIMSGRRCNYYGEKVKRTLLFILTCTPENYYIGRV